MSDVIENTSKVIIDARNRAITSVKAYAQPKIISAIIEIVIAVFIIMGVQLITFKFDLSKLLEWVFWLRTILLSVGIFVLYRAVVNARFPKTETRESVISVKEKYIEKNKLKTLRMKTWLKEVFNVQTKTEAYVDSINRKISKLERKIIRTYNPKKREKYEDRISSLKSVITEEYIIKNIDTIRIKYYIVYYSDFQDISIYGTGSHFTRGNYSRAFNFASFNKMWVYVITTALLGLSVSTLDSYDAFSILFALGSTSFMCATRIVSALMEADQLYDKTITASLLGRIEVLEEWEKYDKEHPTVEAIESEKTKLYNSIKCELKDEYEKAYNEKLEIEKKNIRSECMRIIESQSERVA